jgi:hypothetical protein
METEHTKDEQENEQDDEQDDETDDLINKIQQSIRETNETDDNSDNSSTTSSDSQNNHNNIIKHMLNLYENGLITPEDLSVILERLKDKKNEKCWSKEYVDILSCICERAQCYRYMHEKSSDFYKSLSQKCTYYNMGLSFLLSSFTIVCSEIDFLRPELITLISGIGHLMVASLTGIQKKMKLPEKSESHYKSCSDFDSFARDIEYQLRLPEGDRQIVPKYVLSSIDKYENIVYSTPKIPSKILKSFRYWASSNLDIDQPSIVKTFTNIHDINNNEIYYEQDKKPNNKYMDEFVDIKRLNVFHKDEKMKDKNKQKYKHKKTNRTPKMLKKVKTDKHKSPCQLKLTSMDPVYNKKDVESGMAG